MASTSDDSNGLKYLREPISRANYSSGIALRQKQRTRKQELGDKKTKRETREKAVLISDVPLTSQGQMNTVNRIEYGCREALVRSTNSAWCISLMRLSLLAICRHVRPLGAGMQRPSDIWERVSATLPGSELLASSRNNSMFSPSPQGRFWSSSSSHPS